MSYCYNFVIYTGQQLEAQTEVGLMTTAVTHLTELLCNKGHIVYTDNFYTSTQLATTLLTDGLDLVGILKLNRTGVPQRLKNAKPFHKHADRGMMRYKQAGKMLFVHWEDR